MLPQGNVFNQGTKHAIYQHKTMSIVTYKDKKRNRPSRYRKLVTVCDSERGR